MMTLAQIGASASALGNQMRAGIPVKQALSRLPLLQPAYSEFWLRASLLVQSGNPLSELLKEGWPEALLNAIKAGEQSGKLEDVLTRIEETVELQQSLRAAVMQLCYPIGMGLTGFGVFLGFMVFVIPGLAKAMAKGKGNKSFFFELSIWMNTFFNENWHLILLSLAIAITGTVLWLRTPEARALILESVFKIPIVKDALRDMYFGLWANYMAMMVTAGITTPEALKLTSKLLPGPLQESVLAFEYDLSSNNRPMSDAADLSKQESDDLRPVWWPFYISNAFIIAEQTGEIDRELLRVAKPLIKDGMKTLDRVIGIANIITLILSGLLIVSPLIAYYLEVFSAIKNIGR